MLVHEFIAVFGEQVERLGQVSGVFEGGASRRHAETGLACGLCFASGGLSGIGHWCIFLALLGGLLAGFRGAGCGWEICVPCGWCECGES